MDAEHAGGIVTDEAPFITRGKGPRTALASSATLLAEFAKADLKPNKPKCQAITTTPGANSN